MVDSNDSFLREVKEEIERERLENIWKKYGTLILGVAIAIVVAVGGIQIWHAMSKRAAEQAGIAYQAALDDVFDKKLDEAASAFGNLAKSGSGGYAALAELQLAATLLEQDKRVEALAAYEALGNSGGVDPLISGFARLQAAALRLGDAELKEMQNRLGSLIKDANPWRFNAYELLGMAAWKAGDTELARQSFGRLVSDEDTSPALRQRAELRLSQISAVAKPDAAAQADDKPQDPANAEAATK